jgi:hypothetical protein
MAKLSAHGYEIARVSKEMPTAEDRLSTRERVTISYRSDGHFMRKHDVWFRPGPYDNGKERFHSYGWKLYRKLKGTPAERRKAAPEACRKMADFLETQKGWKRHPVK